MKISNFKITIYFLTLLALLVFAGCHEEHHQDDEHSSVELSIIQEGKQIGLELEAHKDALFTDGNKENPALVEVRDNFDKLIQFQQSDCAYKEKNARTDKEGHHDIYLIFAKVECKSLPSKVSFGFSEIYPSIKQVHIKFPGSKQKPEVTLKTSDILTLNHENN